MPLSLLLTINEYIMVLLAIVGFSSLSYLFVLGFKNFSYYLRFKTFPLTLEQQTIKHLEYQNLQLAKENADLKNQIQEISTSLVDYLKG